MTDVTRNRKAAANGTAGEQAALLWLKTRRPQTRVKILNSLLDLLLDNTTAEIKTCAEFIAAPEKTGRRAGRFLLNEDQHANLTDSDGLYIFVVLRETRPPIIWASRAVDVPFNRQISWTVAIKKRHLSNKNKEV